VTTTTTTTSTTIPNAPAPTIAGTGPNTTEGDLTPGHFYGYAVAWSTSAGSTAHTSQTGLINFAQAKAEVSLNNTAKSSHILVDVPTGPPGVQWLHLYRVDQTAVPGSNPTDYRLPSTVANGAYPGSVRFTDTIAQSAIASAALDPARIRRREHDGDNDPCAADRRAAGAGRRDAPVSLSVERRRLSAADDAEQ
jgi:hypothetical protein